jgi:tetratricopeptide (TPR) repeat protein
VLTLAFFLGSVPSVAQEILDLSPSAEHLIDANRLAEARRELEKLKASEGSSARVRLMEAMVLHREKRHAESLAHLKELLIPEQKDPRVLQLFGLNLVQLKRESDALDFFLAAAKLAPADVTAQYYVGMCELTLTRYSDAERILRTVVEKEPLRVEAWTMLGLTIEQQARPQEAIETYQRAIQTAQQRNQPALEPRLYLGRYLLSLGRFEESVPPLEAAVDEAPEHAEARRLLARAFADTGKPERAIHQLEKALALEPDYRAARYNLARLYQRVGRAEDAARELRAFKTTPAPSSIK